MFSVICNGNNDSKIDGDSSGIWYAGIVVFGKEYAFSQAGVESTRPVRYELLIHLSIIENKMQSGLLPRAFLVVINI